MRGLLEDPARNEPGEAARLLAEHGFSVMPLKPRDKTPSLSAWKQLQSAPADPEQVEAWAAEFPNANWAVLMGPSLVGVDTDTDEADAWAEKTLPKTPFKVRTGKGRHRYYRVSPGLDIRNSAMNGLDTRGAGGYLVAPGSVHASGKRYELEFTDLGYEVSGPDDLPELTGEHLAAIGAYQKVGSSGPASGVLFNTGDIYRPATGAPVAPGGRNSAAASMAGQLFTAGRSMAETRAALHDWNQRNPAPLPAAEVDLTVESIAATHLHNNAGAVIEAAPPPRPAPLIFKWSDFRQNPEPRPEPIWRDGVLFPGARVLVAGPAKAGKSRLVTDWARAMATGGEFLGEACTRAVSVLWLQAEIAPGFVSERLAGLETGMSEDEKLSFRQNFFFSGRIDFDITNPAERNHLVQLIEPFNPEVLIIDPVINFSTADENSNPEVRALCRVVDSLSAVLGCAVVLVHHSGKGVKGGDHFETAIRGASAFRGWYDTGMVLLQQKGGPITLAYECRNVASPPAHGLFFDEHGRACVSFLPSGGKAKDVDHDAVLADIRKFLGKQTEPLAKTTVTDHHCGDIGHSAQDLRAVVSEALERGELALVPHPEKKRGRGFVLVDNAASSRWDFPIDSPISNNHRAKSELSGGC